MLKRQTAQHSLTDFFNLTFLAASHQLANIDIMFFILGFIVKVNLDKLYILSLSEFFL